MGADVELDVDVDRRGCVHRSLRQRGHDAFVVDEHADVRTPRKRGNALELARLDDFVRDEDIRDAGIDECDRFVGLLATDADRAPRDLQLRDHRTLV